MTYTLPAWANAPSTASPVNATNLGQLNTAINDLDSRVTVASGLDPLQSAAATAVRINTGDNAQTVVNAQPAGTVFVIKTGTHAGFNLNLNGTQYGGMSFIGEPGAVLDGQGSTLFCLKGYAPDVTFRGWSAQQMMTVQNYTPPAAQTTVVACCINDDQRQSLPGWELAYLNVTDNAYVSVRGGASSNIHDMNITRAGTVALSGAGQGSPLRPCLVKNIVITDFNASNSAPGFEGGIKFAVCRYVDISYLTIVGNPNHSAAHDAYGLWFDVDCDNVVVHHCNISHVPRAGLISEISGNMKFYRNTISNCGFAWDGIGQGSSVPAPGWGFGAGAGILISASGHNPWRHDGIDVFDNTITNCNEGIVVLEQRRGIWRSDQLTHYYGQDIRILNNTIANCGGSGMITDLPNWDPTVTYTAGTWAQYREDASAVYYNGQYFMSNLNGNLNNTPTPNTGDVWWEYVCDHPTNLTTRRIRWNKNTYTGNCGPAVNSHCPGSFYWASRNTSFAQWQAALQDSNGTFS